MNKLLSSLFILSNLIYLPSALATTLLTAHPITAGIAELLSKESTITIKTATPRNLPASRQLNYLENRGKESLVELSQQADAVITIKSIYAPDFLYPLARRHHIQIVPIDIAIPIDGSNIGVAKLDISAVEHPVWLDPENLNSMLLLFAREVERLDYSQHDAIQKQLIIAQKHLQSIVQNMQHTLAVASHLPTVLLMQEELTYLTQGLQLESTLFTSDDISKNVDEFEKTIQQQKISLVISQSDPTPAEQVTLTRHNIAWMKIPRLKNENPLLYLEGIYKTLQAFIK